MSENKGKRILTVALIYIFLITLGGLSWKYIFQPRRQKKILDETGTTSQYKHTLTLAIDSFSGYAILRSSEFHKDLKTQGIKLQVKDDQGDYKARIRALWNGEVQLAVFTVDSLVLTSAGLGEYPGTIILVIDESCGADAIVAYKSAVPTFQEMDHPDARFVLTPNSPSEFMARVVLADLNLANLSPKWITPANGAMDVYKQFRAADHAKKTAYVLWEPAVTLALKEDGAHTLLDSSQIKGFIMDVLVAKREYLVEHHDVVKAVAASYFRSVYHYTNKAKGLENLVMEDSRQKGMTALDEVQTKKLVSGILWKNTMENYGHFGLLSGSDSQGLSHIEDIINKITQVLVITRALESDPLGGDPGKVFYNKILKELMAEGFHPGKKLNILTDPGVGVLAPDNIRVEKNLPPLTEEQWKRLQPIGELRIEPISFARGTDRINIQSKRSLDELCNRLRSWPKAYMRIIGNTRPEGDLTANKILAYKRSNAVREYLLSKGIEENRIRTEASEDIGKEGGTQTVSFVLGYIPY